MVIFHSYVKLPEGNVWVCPITNHVWVWNLSKPTTWGHGQELKNTRGYHGIFLWSLVEHLNSLWRNIWRSLGDQRIGRDGTWRKECDRFTILSLMTFTFAIWLHSDETQQRNLGANSMKTRAKAFHGLRDGFFHHRELTWFTIWVVPQMEVPQVDGL